MKERAGFRTFAALLGSVLAGGAIARVWRSYARFQRGFVPILAYHALTNEPRERHEMKVQRAQFERQMGWLARHGYETAPSAQLASEAPTGRRVGVSFDDGFASVHQFALPVLRKLGLRATVFVSTDYVGHTAQFPWDYAAGDPPLTWAQIDELRAGGFEIGSHACSHRELPQLDDGELARELQESCRIVRQATGEAPKTLAYPHGSFDERVKSATARAGYAAAFAVYSQPEQADAFSVPRILIRNQTSLLGFRLRIWGLHPFLKSRGFVGLLRPWLVRLRWAFL